MTFAASVEFSPRDLARPDGRHNASPAMRRAIAGARHEARNGRPDSWIGRRLHLANLALWRRDMPMRGWSGADVDRMMRASVGERLARPWPGEVSHAIPRTVRAAHYSDAAIRLKLAQIRSGLSLRDFLRSRSLRCRRCGGSDFVEVGGGGYWQCQREECLAMHVGRPVARAS